MTPEQKVRHAVEAWMRKNPVMADRLHPQATPDAFFEVDDWDLGELVPHVHVNDVEGRLCVNRRWFRAASVRETVDVVGWALDRMTWSMLAEQDATPTPERTEVRTTWIDRVLEGIRTHAEQWAVIYMFLAVGVLAGSLIGLALAGFAFILGR